jgi:ferric-dicitrate binding protein FerR (iron transport regulator)
MTEGRVAVSRRASATAPAASIFLEAGSQVAVSFDPTRALPTADASPAEAVAAALAWRNRRVEFTRTTVAGAAQLFNRRNPVQLRATDPTLARLVLRGIFWDDDPEGFVRLLESGLRVRAERAGHVISLHGR